MLWVGRALDYDLEVELQRRVCRGLMSQSDAQREIAEDWTEPYRRYVGRVPVAATGYDGTGPARAVAKRPTWKARLEAAGLRLARRWMYDWAR